MGILACVVCNQPAPTPAKADKPKSPAPRDVEPAPKPASPTAKPAAPPPKTPKSSEPKARGVTYDDELATLRGRFEQHLKRTQKVPGRAPWQGAAGTAMQIARLTGSYADYKIAEDTIGETFKTNSKHGAYLLRAKFNYHVHRIDVAQGDMEMAGRAAVAGGSKGAAGVAILNGKLAMHRSEYDKALEFWATANRLDKNSADLTLALWAFKTADFETAERIYTHHSRNYHARESEGIAWLHLMLAIMDLDRGRYDDALVHLDDADAQLSGYWLVDEHRAEITALKGDLTTAETMYRDIIKRTNSPEFMGALAGVLLEASAESTEAKEWIERANARFDEQIALFPEAAYGHALGHYLEFGPPKRALELARKNFKVRPNADARIMLAQAELAMGDVKAARKAIDVAVASPWSTADLHETAYQVYTADGDAALAAEQLAKAKAINPTVEAIEAAP